MPKQTSLIETESSQNAESSADSSAIAPDLAQFESLISNAKEALNKLNATDISLKEAMELYKKGMQSLKNAQNMLESAKLQYQEFKD